MKPAERLRLGSARDSCLGNQLSHPGAQHQLGPWGSVNAFGLRKEGYGSYSRHHTSSKNNDRCAWRRMATPTVPLALPYDADLAVPIAA